MCEVTTEGGLLRNPLNTPDGGIPLHADDIDLLLNGTVSSRVILDEVDAGARPPSQEAPGSWSVRIVLMVHENLGRLDTSHSVLVSDFEDGTRLLGGPLLVENCTCARQASSRLLFEQSEIQISRSRSSSWLAHPSSFRSSGPAPDLGSLGGPVRLCSPQFE